ncbi:hypothetical protein J6590_050119 [Homalodisca vitripennis]|nr:hypothetical protein J6590_050119 [Homalodisca vitripennis]
MSFILNPGDFHQAYKAGSILPESAETRICPVERKSVWPQWKTYAGPIRYHLREHSVYTSKPHFPQVRLEVGRRTFSYFGPTLYNDLPDYILTNARYNEVNLGPLEQWFDLADELFLHRPPTLPFHSPPPDPLNCSQPPQDKLPEGWTHRWITYARQLCSRIKQRRAWLLLGWVTAERSCPCKQPACPAIGGGSEVTFKHWSPALMTCPDPSPHPVAILRVAWARDNGARTVYNIAMVANRGNYNNRTPGVPPPLVCEPDESYPEIAAHHFEGVWETVGGRLLLAALHLLLLLGRPPVTSACAVSRATPTARAINNTEEASRRLDRRRMYLPEAPAQRPPVGGRVSGLGWGYVNSLCNSNIVYHAHLSLLHAAPIWVVTDNTTVVELRARRPQNI